MKEKIRKKTKRPQTEDMIFTEEDFEDVSEETKANSPKHRKRSRRTSGGFPARKAGIIAGGVIGVLVLLYLGISVFFMSHFYINTTINGKDFSGRSASSVEAYIKEQVKDYKLTIKEQDSKSDVIKGSDISLQYKESDEIEKALKKQNGFAWPLALFSKKSEKISIAVSFDETALNEKIQNLQAVTAEQIPAENAKPELQGDTYVIKEEVYGTAVDMDVLKEKVNQYISEFRSELDMEKEGCYARPKYTKDSKEVQAACQAGADGVVFGCLTPEGELDKPAMQRLMEASKGLSVTFHRAFDYVKSPREALEELIGMLVPKSPPYAQYSLPFSSFTKIP